MLHEVFELTRPLIVFDLETTGVDTSTARIVEIAFIYVTAQGVEKQYVQRINPTIPIPPETTEAHHITDDDVKDMPRFSQLAKNIAYGFKDCDYAGKNVRFDLRVLQSEMNREGVDWSYAGARIIDAERLEQLAVPRTLSNLYEKYTGEKLEDAHNALVDTKASLIVLYNQLTQHAAVLPHDVEKLHELQWPGWIDSEGKFRMKNGVPYCTFGKYRDTPMRDIPIGYWKWILTSDFSLELKKLASDAIRKVYPGNDSSTLFT